MFLMPRILVKNCQRGRSHGAKNIRINQIDTAVSSDYGDNSGADQCTWKDGISGKMWLENSDFELPSFLSGDDMNKLL